MFLFTYTAAILSTIFVVIAAVFFIHKPNQIRTALACYLITGAMWIGANAAADVAYTPPFLILISQIAYCGGILNLFFCVLLVDILVDQRFPSVARITLYALPCLMCVVTGFSPYAIKDIAFPSNAPAEIMPGVLYDYTVYLYLAGLIYCIIRLWYIASRNDLMYVRRMQLWYIFSGLIITALATLIFDILLPLSGELRFFTLGPLSSIFFAAACAYAITRYRFLDIRLVIQLGAIYTVLSGILIACYLILIEITEEVFGDGSITSEILGVTLTTVIGRMTIPHFERWFRKQTDPWFFKDTYDYPEAMHTLSEILSTAQTSAEVVMRVEGALSTILRVSFVNITLYQNRPSTTETILGKNRLLVPIMHDDAPIGTIEVGAKRSGDAFAAEDTQLLSTFVYQAANALLRVSLHQEVERYAKHLEHMVQEKTKEILALQEKQQQMILDVSHNLQTPLAIFQIQLERAKGTYLGIDTFTGLEHSLTTLSQFIYDLLALTTMENTMKQEVPEQFDLSETIRESLEELEIICTDKGIMVEGTLMPRIFICGNQKRIREAFMNLLSNSVKYMGADDPKEIRVSLSVRNDRVFLVISDTGVGMDPQELPHIFDRFYRPKQSKTDSTGTGLGLAIAKSIIEQHNGTIAVASTHGEGSAFTVELPRVHDE